jgi:2,3-bisphosphoglycerate-independent phosphoglycerate mutase
MSGNASPHVSDCDPMIRGKAIARIRALDRNPEPGRAERTAAALNEYLTHCHRLLASKQIQANFLSTQRCGRRIYQEPFHQRWGLSGTILASESIYLGLAQELGMHCARVQNGDDPGEDLRERIRLALDDPDHDFIHVHTKAPDEAAHGGNPLHKQRVITSLDGGFDELIQSLESRDDLLVAVTADHSTPTLSNLIHSGEPVPLVLTGPNVRVDHVTLFDEINAARGCLGLLRGKELMQMLLNYADRSSLKGHRLGNKERPYLPEDYEPFKPVS